MDPGGLIPPLQRIREVHADAQVRGRVGTSGGHLLLLAGMRKTTGVGVGWASGKR